MGGRTFPWQAMGESGRAMSLERFASHKLLDEIKGFIVLVSEFQVRCVHWMTYLFSFFLVGATCFLQWKGSVESYLSSES